MNLKQSIYISGLGIYNPKKILTNINLSKNLDTSDDWIRSRTGIISRRISNKKEKVSYMGLKSAIEAIKNSNIEKEEISFMIVATMTPEFFSPSIACIIQNKLGLKKIPCFDISAACSGFIYALEIGTNMIQSNPNYKNALIIGSEKISKVVNWKDRKTCILFGDGSGSIIIQKSSKKKRKNKIQYKIIDNIIQSDGKHYKLLYISALHEPYLSSDEKNFLKMDGKKIFKIAVKKLTDISIKILKKNNINLKQINWIIPHQANIRIIQALSKNLNISIKKFFINIQKYGNTSSASIPIALKEAHDQKLIKKGDFVLLLSFGSGVTWGASLIKFQESQF
jgi:3-oxoacyl-[acyl-carrier-protein] synthase-3